jgi:hypothetical protein
MFDAVGKAGWADKMQWCSAMQAPAAADQNPQNGQYATRNCGSRATAGEAKAESNHRDRTAARGGRTGNR